MGFEIPFSNNGIDILQSIAAPELENDLRIFKQSVMKARAEAIAFYSDIEAAVP